MVQTIITKTLLAITLLVVIFSCNPNQENNPPLFSPKVVKAHGYIVPKDSMAEPKVIPVGKPTVVRAGKPKVVPTHTNVHPAGNPRVVIAGVPKVYTPGQDGLSLPRTVPAINSPFIAGIPEVLIAKEAYAKDQNSQNFSSFSKRQGLTSEAISCLLEDKSGNLWIGTNWGVSKYDGKSFTHFTEKEGLSSNWVLSMFEDKSGNLWFGTFDAGVSKYDGKSFTHFAEKEGLSNNRISSIVEDKSGNLWFGTWGGVFKYDGKSFTHFTEKEGLSSNFVLSMLEDERGDLWFGTIGGGVSKYDHKSFTHFTEKEGLGNNRVSSILQDKNGDLWFGTEGGGVSRYDHKNFTHFTEKEGLSSNLVLSILEDKSGDLWFGTEVGGVSKYDHKSFTHFTEKEGLSNNDVNSILKDKRGNLWFGTQGGGVNKYGGKNFTHFTVKDGLSDNRVRSILQDKSGNLWFGTTSAGVNKYDGKSFTHLTNKEGMRINNVSGMLEDKRGDLWFGDWSGVSKYDGESFTYFTTEADMTASMLQDKSGNYWFGSWGEGVFQYDGNRFTHFTTKEGLSGNVVSNIFQDKKDNLWFCTYDGGLSKYDGRSFTHFTEKEGLSNNAVFSVIEDKNGNFWVGSKDGVSKYDGKNFTHFTEREDKSGNLWFGTRFGLSKLEKDELTSGLSDSDFLFKTYTYEDGFAGIDVNVGRNMYEANDGTIWIGAGDRLTAFHPDEDSPDTIPPNIQLTGITLFNENIAWQNLMYPNGVGGKSPNNHRYGINDTSIVLGNGVKVHDFHFDSVSNWYGVPERLSLAYNNNNLTFQFVGITIQSPKKVKYKFKLEGLDQNWSALTDRAEAPYGNLPHGKYTFKVKAMNGDGYWSNEFNYSFTIRPPWWLTWWAYAIFALLFAGLIYALFRYRLNKIRMQHEIVLQQHKAIELEMQALRAQMNPHFIFNCLSSINHFILQNESETASGYLTKFSRLIRMVLNNSRKPLITLEEELEMLRLYIDLEMLRFKNSFDYNVVLNDSLDVSSVFIPPLVLQPFVENAIWHGLMNLPDRSRRTPLEQAGLPDRQAGKKEQGILEVAFELENGLLNCYITDNGVGREKAEALRSKSAEKQKSMGMQITTERLTLLNENDEQTTCSVEDLVNDEGQAAGTRVTLKIRYKESFGEPG